jgi:hypothetical protein
MATTRRSKEEVQDEMWRENIAGLPLAKRQQVAKELEYRDGLPFTESEVRNQAQRLLDEGMDRTRTIKALSVARASERRIGSLNPDEVAVIVDEILTRKETA